MSRIAHRPLFSLEVLVISVLVILLGVLLSQGLVAVLHKLLFS